jgi:alpha-2-macroglobulin
MRFAEPARMQRVDGRYGLFPALLALTFAALPMLCPPAAAQPAAAGSSLRVSRITPAGTNVGQERQIVFQLDRPVVPLGRMDRTADEVPIEISPDLGCSWRWLDTSTLACQLGEAAALQPATRYSIVVRPELIALDGAVLAAAVRHTFETERPRINFAWFATWYGPGSPVIRAVFTQPVTAATVAEHLFFSSGATRIDASVEPDPDDLEPPSAGSNQEEARRIWQVTPAEPLPLDVSAVLRIEPGLEPTEGVLRGDEARSVVEFDTFPEPRFVGITCSTNDDRQLLIRADGATAPSDDCNPLGGIGLSFSAPVAASEVRDKVAFVPPLDGGREDFDPWANVRDYSQLYQPHRSGQLYTVWLPGRLEAAAAYRLSTRGEAELDDEFGRPLALPVVAFRTDHRPPDYTLAHSTAVLEAAVDSDVPLYVTNLDEVTLDYRTLTEDGESRDLTRRLSVPDVEDVSFAVPLDIRTLLGERTGALYATLSTRPGLGKSEWERRLFAQVAPYQVHIKLGHFNTLVWVVDFASGEPISGAKVSIYTDRIADLTASAAPIAAAETDESGIALLAGAATLDPALDLLGYRCQAAHPDECPRLFARVDGPGGLALLPLDDRFEASVFRASSYAFGPQPAPVFGHLASWGTTAQGVYRAGDTMAYKLYVRDQSNETLVPAPRGPYTLEILDPTGRSVHTVESVMLSRFGAYDGEYRIPETAAVGWYRFKLTAGFSARSLAGAPAVRDGEWDETEIVRFPMRVLVSDFTPAPFAVATRIDGDHFGAGAVVGIETSAALHSGGAYVGAEARLTARLTARPFTSAHPLASRFRFDAADDLLGAPAALTVAQHVGPVDGDGRLRHAFTVPDDAARRIVHGRLEVEGAVRDDRGRYVASSASASFVAVDRLVGLRTSRWVHRQGEPAEVEYLVVDAQGAPAEGSDVSIAIERLETKASRVKGAGNAYLTRYVDEWVAAGTCEGRSTTAPLTCRFTPAAPGVHRLIATIDAPRGQPHRTVLHTWVAGDGEVVWNAGNDDALEIVPEKSEYAVGETARYLVQNPYPGARALVTVERYGVLAQWVETLGSHTPIVEFEVESDFMPGFYLSVLVMSPRVDAPPPEVGELDLGKPAFKLGYVSVPVRDPYKQLDVTVETDADTYKPGATVRARIAAAPRMPGSDEPVEVAIVVLDESVLDLIQDGTAYFDPYAGFYAPGSLDVRNFSLLTRLVGRQQIELKGANPGGDGGAAFAMRSLFEYVGFFDPSVELDDDGRGEIEFRVPDNLTGWRVLALAVTASDRMGLGMHRFTANLPTEIRPAMPNQVAEGDRFTAAFSVMNRTAATRELRVAIRAEGDIESTVGHEQRIELGPFARTIVSAPIEAGSVALDRDVARGRIRFTVTAADDADGDALTHEIPIRKRIAFESAAQHGVLDDDEARERLLLPDGLRPDAGEIAAVLSPTVIGNLDGAFRDARGYGHPSWEQRLTRAVMASLRSELAEYLSDDAAADGPDVVRAALERAAEHQAPSGGMAYFRPEDAYVDPYLSAYTALAFAWLYNAGYALPAAVETRLLDYLAALLRQDAVPTFYSRGMTATSRAVALAALAARGRLSLDDLERYREHVERMSLFGKAHYLVAAFAVDGAEQLAEFAVELLLRDANRTAGSIAFEELIDAGYRRMLGTPARANCAILTAFAAAGSDASSIGLDPLATALARSVVRSRGGRDHWRNAQENVFCTRALADYARRYETEAPNVAVDVAIDGEPLGRAAFSAVTDPAATVARPVRADDAGAERVLLLARQGSGLVYYTVRVDYAPAEPVVRAVDAGVELRKEIRVERGGEWELLNDEAHVARGELVRVDLIVSLPAARNFLVVEDPLPGGLEPVSRDLATASLVDADAAPVGSGARDPADFTPYNASRWSFHHEELRHDVARFYSDHLPAGRYRLSYAAQAIAEGRFDALPPRAFEMYDPDVYGSDRGRTLIVEAP